MANLGTLAGHVTIDDRAVLGGLAAIHQFVRIGRLCIIGGCSKVVQDVPPFSLVDGHPARIYGINSIGLKRAQIPLPIRETLKKALRILVAEGWAVQTAIRKIEKELPPSPELSHLVQFVRSTKRGIPH
jgi:UDP-N-acetylglucosamine acyltransferase